MAHATRTRRDLPPLDLCACVAHTSQNLCNIQKFLLFKFFFALLAIFFIALKFI